MTIRDFRGGLALRPFNIDITNFFGVIFNNIDQQRTGLQPLTKPIEINKSVEQCDGKDIVVNTNSETLIYKEVSIGWNKLPDNLENSNDLYYITFCYKNVLNNSYTKVASPVPVVGNKAKLYIDLSDKTLLLEGDYNYIDIYVGKVNKEDNSNVTGKIDTIHTLNNFYLNEEVEIKKDMQDVLEVNIDVSKTDYTKEIPDNTGVWDKSNWCFNTYFGADLYKDSGSLNINNIIFFIHTFYDDNNKSQITHSFHLDIANNIKFKFDNYKPDNINHSIYAYVNNKWIKQFENDNTYKESLVSDGEELYVPCHIKDNILVKESKDITLNLKNSCSIIPYKDADKWFYSNIRDKIIPLRKEESAVDLLRWTIIYNSKDSDKSIISRVDKNFWIKTNIQKPEIKNITTISNSQGDIDVKYRITYYNSILGIESEASDFKLIKVKDGGKVKLTVSIPPEGSMTNIRVYRIQKGLLFYTLCSIVDAETSEIEDIVYEDISYLAGREVLDDNTITSGPPPSGLKYPITYGAVIVGAVDSKLYYSDIGNPIKFNKSNYIEFDNNITGIGKTQQGLLVFTKTDTYIIVGSSPTTFAKYLLNAEIGCINGDTVKSFKGGVAWCGIHGIYLSDGSNIHNITYNNLGKLYLEDKTITATVANSSYYLLLKDDDIFDTEYYTPTNKPVILEIDNKSNVSAIKTITEDAKYINNINDEVCFTNKDNNKIYKMFSRTNDRRVMHFKSGKLKLARASEVKYFKDVYIAYEGDIHIKITLQTKTKNVVILDKKLPVDRNIYNAKTKHNYEGYSIEIEIIGTGKIFEIDFRAVGRENGK